MVERMKMRRVSILCVQETRWKGSRAKELGEGYKLNYSAATADGRNGVGIILSEKKKQYVTEVKREGDRLMVLRLVYGDCPINIVSAYAPQTELPEEVKEEFWVDMERVIEGLAMEERVIVGADLNGHIGTSSEGWRGYMEVSDLDGQMLKDVGCWTSLCHLTLQLQTLSFARGRSTTSHKRVEEIRLR